MKHYGQKRFSVCSCCHSPEVKDKGAAARARREAIWLEWGGNEPLPCSFLAAEEPFSEEA